MSEAVRAATADDLPAFKRIIDGVELFPSEMLDAMIAPFLAGQGDDFWLAHGTGQPWGLIYCAPERMTEGTWNQLLIAVDPLVQGRGIGKALMHAVETRLAERGERLLLVETSGLPSFKSTRGFYRAIGYKREARIRDFYQAGEDKIVFVKHL